MIELQLEATGLQQIAADLAATDVQVRQALNSTLRKMAAWMRGKSVPGIAKAANIPQKVVRRRMRTLRLTQSPSGPEITLWYGLDPVGMIYLQAKKIAGGVKAYGGRYVKGAFIANGKNDNRQVFKRRGQKRLPIEKQVAQINDAVETYMEDDLVGSAEFEARFLTVFERELNWRTTNTQG